MDEADEQRFLRMFSKQLADALRAKDEEEAEERERIRGGHRPHSSRTINDAGEWERIRSAYSELCHDDPIVSGGDGDCRRLARALVPRYSASAKSSVKEDDAKRLALSSRLVEGVLQATARSGARASSQSGQINNDADAGHESMFGSITSSGGYAELAFTVFVEGPYRCIQADNLHETSAFLGSFELPDASNNATPENLLAEEKSRLVDEATARIVEGMEKMGTEVDEEKAPNNAAPNVQDDGSSSSSEFFRPNATQTAQQQDDDDNDSLEEVFAEDSDPDDYDYGESYTTYQDAFKGAENASSFVHDNFLDAFDPLKLSEPSATNQTWEGARKSIHYLLSSASYGKLALGSLSSRSWSDAGMSETLADLSFILILGTMKQQGDAGKPDSLMHSTNDEGQHEVEDIASLWDRPLLLLRDRALDKNRGHDALPAYLQLLTAFMSHSSEQDVASILSSPLGQSTEGSTLPPTTSVGLSSLASICSSKEMTSSSSGQTCGTSVWSVCPREEVKKAIISSVGHLSHAVERVRPKKSISASTGTATDVSASETSPWTRTAICIIPIIEYLTNLQARYDFQPLFEGGGSRSASLSEADAKAIYDSGLFREMLSLYTATSTPNDTLDAGKPKGVDVVRMQLLHTILTLSAQSPELLGRYAVRVPDFSKEVHSSDFMKKNPVDGILWTSIGSSLLESKSSSQKPRLKLRANAKLKTPVETRSLAERSISGFEAMFSSAKDSLDKLTKFVEGAEERSLSEEERKEYEACKETLGGIKRFSNCLSNCPSATALWLDSLKNNQDSTPKAAELVAELKEMLSKLPFSSDKIEAPQGGHKKDDDDDDRVETTEDGKKVASLNQLRKDYGGILASTRSSVKVIALALESQKGAGLPLKGPPSPCDFSSKTD